MGVLVELVGLPSAECNVRILQFTCGVLSGGGGDGGGAGAGERDWCDRTGSGRTRA